MAESEIKLKEIEKIYSDVVERLDATTKLFNEFRDSVDSEKQLHKAEQPIPTQQSNNAFQQPAFVVPPVVIQPAHQTRASNLTFVDDNCHSAFHSQIPLHCGAHQLSREPSHHKPPLATPQMSYHTVQTQRTPMNCQNECISQSLCVKRPTDCSSQQGCLKCIPECSLQPSAENVDLGAMEVLMLLTDGYIQQCEGNPAQEESKSKLRKLRKKILLNRNFKPKAIAKFMEYVQRIGGEVMKTKCQQNMYNIPEKESVVNVVSNQDVKESDNPLNSKSVKSLASSANVCPSNTKTKCSGMLKPCLINGVEAISLGKVVPIGKLSNCMSQKQHEFCCPSRYMEAQDPKLQQQNLVYNGTPANVYDNWMRKQPQVGDIREPENIIPNNFYVNPNFNQQMPNSPRLSYQLASNADLQKPSVPNIPQDRSIYEQPQPSHMSMAQRCSPEQQGLHAQASQMGQQFLPQTSRFASQNVTNQTYPYPQQDVSTQVSEMLAAQRSQQPSQMAVPQQLLHVAAPHRQLSTIQSSQQFLAAQASPSSTVQVPPHLSPSQLRQEPGGGLSKQPSRSKSRYSQNLNVIHSEQVLNNVEDQDSPADNLMSQVCSQGTQYYDTEILVHPPNNGNTTICVKHPTNKQIKNLQNQQHCKQSVSAKSSCIESDDERSETMIERLERKSLNIPEGTLVTDGMNVYYITKPNDCDDKASNEEVIVNIPIKGSQLLKPKGESNSKERRCSCGNSASSVKERKKSKDRKSSFKEGVLDQLQLRLDSERTFSDDEENEEDQTKEKKAKSHSTIADFETCICSNCFPDKENQVSQVMDSRNPSYKPFPDLTTISEDDYDQTNNNLPDDILASMRRLESIAISNENLGDRFLYDIKLPFSSKLATNVRTSDTPPIIPETEEPKESPPLFRQSLDSPVMESKSKRDMEKFPATSKKNSSINGDPLKKSDSQEEPEVYSDARSLTSLLSKSATGLPPGIEGKVVRTNSIKSIQKRQCLEHVFNYLDFKSLHRASEVCQEWKIVARRPSLWRKLEITGDRISPKYLKTISNWCTQVKVITLQGLKTPKKRRSEPIDKFLESVEGTLEAGLEQILRASHTNIKTISIIGCSNLFTDNILWLIGSNCPNLQRLAYVSAHSPPGKESLWGLGSGCKLLNTLLLPPVSPCKYPLRFDDECCEVIGRSWPDLKVLCIGGEGVSANGLIWTAKLCQSLQILELDRALPMSKKIVEAMTYVGLKDLELIELNHTRISDEALKAFGAGCPKLIKLNYDQSQNKKKPKTDNVNATRTKNSRSRTQSKQNDFEPGNENQEAIPARPLHEIVSLHGRNAEVKSNISKVTQRNSVVKPPSKEEQDNALENKLIATKRLNAETAQEMEEKQKHQRRSKRLSEKLPEPRKHSDGEISNRSSSLPARNKRPRSTTNKTSEEWQEALMEANPEGAKMANRYESKQNKLKSFYHQSLADQIAQSGEKLAPSGEHRNSKQRRSKTVSSEHST